MGGIPDPAAPPPGRPGATTKHNQHAIVANTILSPAKNTNMVVVVESLAAVVANAIVCNEFIRQDTICSVEATMVTAKHPTSRPTMADKNHRVPFCSVYWNHDDDPWFPR